MARTDLLWSFVTAMLETQHRQLRFRLPTPRKPEAPRTAVPRVTSVWRLSLDPT